MEIDEKIKKKNTAIPPDYKPLVEYDICFRMSAEKLSMWLDFANSVNSYIHFIFMKDCLVIRQKSSSIYAEIKINKDSLIDYNPGLELTNNNGEVIESKYVVIDIRHILANIKKSTFKDEITTVKIDKLHYNRIEFILKEPVIVWTSIQKDPKPNTDLSSIIYLLRKDDKIIRAKTVLEPDTFNAILKRVGKNKRDIDQRLFITLDKEGLEVISGDNLGCRRFDVKCYPNNVDIEAMERESRQQMESFKNPKSKANTKKIATHELLTLDADISQTVLIESSFLIPFSKIENISPIHMEISTDAPLVLEIKPSNGVKVLYSVGPRIESRSINKF